MERRESNKPHPTISLKWSYVGLRGQRWKQSILKENWWALLCLHSIKTFLNGMNGAAAGKKRNQLFSSSIIHWREWWKRELTFLPLMNWIASQREGKRENGINQSTPWAALFINEEKAESGCVDGMGHQGGRPPRQVHQLSLLFALPLREAKKKKRVEWKGYGRFAENSTHSTFLLFLQLPPQSINKINWVAVAEEMKKLVEWYYNSNW